MDYLKFEWDNLKNMINQRKHGVSFEEAQTVFCDESAVLVDDPDHSTEEERFVILGMSQQANVLVVCHCYRRMETIIRIISARRATRREAATYALRGEKDEKRI